MVWPSNCGSGNLTKIDTGQTFTGIFTGQVLFFFFDKSVLAGIVVDNARQRCPETSDVRTTFWVEDVVGKGFDGFGVGIGVLQRNFHLAVLDWLIDVEDVVIDGFLADD